MVISIFKKNCGEWSFRCRLPAGTALVAKAIEKRYHRVGPPRLRSGHSPNNSLNSVRMKRTWSHRIFTFPKQPKMKQKHPQKSARSFPGGDAWVDFSPLRSCFSLRSSSRAASARANSISITTRQFTPSQDGTLPTFYPIFPWPIQSNTPMPIMASYWWVRFLKEGRSRFLYAFVFSASLALLTKQQCIYLALFCPLTATILRKWRLLVSWSAVKAFAIMLLLVAPFYLLAFSVHWRVVSAHLVHLRGTPGPLF